MHFDYKYIQHAADGYRDKDNRIQDDFVMFQKHYNAFMHYMYISVQHIYDLLKFNNHMMVNEQKIDKATLDQRAKCNAKPAYIPWHE